MGNSGSSANSENEEEEPAKVQLLNINSYDKNKLVN